MREPPVPTIQIDGKDYNLDQLSNDAKAQLASLQFLDAELARLKAQAAALQTARMAYAKALHAALPALPQSDIIKFQHSSLSPVVPVSIEKTLLKARQHVQSGQYDAAIKLYRGLLRLTPKHPQINSLLGTVLIQVGRPEQAVEPLEVAFAGQPENPENWVRLLIAHHRGGSIHRARELLEWGADIGVPEDRLAVFRNDLSEPPETAARTVDKLMEAGNRVSAEIAARMLVTDYPDSRAAQDCLNRVIGAIHEH